MRMNEWNGIEYDNYATVGGNTYETGVQQNIVDETDDFGTTMQYPPLNPMEESIDHYDIESSDRVDELAKKYSSNINEYAGKYENLVSSADGVGTKILLAQYARVSFNRPLNSIGQDVVAMVVNDLLCKGAKPLFFLDYFASSKIPHDQFHEVLAGIHSACTQISIPLLGGETANLPGIIAETTFDVAGFGVGRIEHIEDELPKNIEENDVVIGIKSSGFHSNGFTLIRKNIGWREGGQEEFINKLLTPTKMYVQDLKLINDTAKIKGLAHITGNGFDNIKRILPDNMEVKYDDSFLYENDYPAHADMFRWIQEREFMTTAQMYATFNCGIGMVVIVSPDDAEMMKRSKRYGNMMKTNNEISSYHTENGASIDMVRMGTTAIARTYE